MKNLTLSILKSTLPAFLLGICFTASAQKLPNTQQASVRAPASMKMDGKALEWDNMFKAYNNATNMYYTMSNDDNFLYLTVQADDQSVINKIMRGGITFMVNTSGKKNDKDAVSITYPIFGTDRPRITFKDAPKIEPGSEISVKRADSFMYATNRMLNEKSRNIITKGIKGIDTLISVYNEDGIKAAEGFNNKMVYTCEMAIDLKHLGLTAGSLQKFAYNVKLNGINIDDLMKNMTITKNADGSISKIAILNAPAGGGGGAPAVVSFNTTSFGGGPLPAGAATGMSVSSVGGDQVRVVSGSGSGLQTLTTPTDFWGEYTLAKP